MRAGDQVLMALGEHLQTLFGDRVIRFGGDEFLVVWERDDVRETARKVVDSVRALSITTFESFQPPGPAKFERLVRPFGSTEHVERRPFRCAIRGPGNQRFVNIGASIEPGREVQGGIDPSVETFARRSNRLTAVGDLRSYSPP